MERRKYRHFLKILLLAYLIFVGIYAYVDCYQQVPDELNVSENLGERNPSFSVPVSLDLGGLRTEGTYEVSSKLLGWIPLKTVSVNVVKESRVTVGGIPVGIYLKTEGILVIGNGQVKDLKGQLVVQKGGIQAGDYLVSLDGRQIHSIGELQEVTNSSQGRQLKALVRRGGQELEVGIQPILTAPDKYMLGIWVRQDSQGIGTLTYIKDNGQFGALGHGISDNDTRELLHVQDGLIYQANVWGIRKNTQESIGGILGNIIYRDENVLGSIEENQNKGIYGTLSVSSSALSLVDTMPLAYKQEVKKGRALIRTKVSGKLEDYEVEIQEISLSARNQNQGMVIQITDPRLLKLTGGIIQGMSGSPIIQDGRLIGAVTHVFLKDPTKGYGIFIENMLNHGGN